MKDTLGGLGISEEQIDLKNVATAFCQEKSPVDAVRRRMEEGGGEDPSVWSEIVDLGWLGIAIPEAYDGVGLGLAEVVPVVEQMGRNLMSGPFVSTTLVAQLILAAGTEALKAEWLPRLATGMRASLALTEDGAGYEIASAKASATKEGEDVRLSGRKLLVTDADTADIIAVSVTSDGAPGFVLIERDRLPESALRKETVIDETRRSFELTLDGITVPMSHLLDPEKSRHGAEQLELAGNLLMTAELCGGTQACIDYTVDYLKTRTQFGKTIGSFQALKHPIVDAYADYEKARSHLYSAAWVFGEQGRGEVAVRMAKAQAAKAMSFAADRAIQFHGGFGFTYDCDAQLYRRRAFWCANQFGDARYHKKKLASLLLS